MLQLWYENEKGCYVCSACSIMPDDEPFTTKSPDGALDHVRRHQSHDPCDHEVPVELTERLSEDRDKHGMETEFDTIFGRLRSGFECGEGWYDILYEFGRTSHAMLTSHTDAPVGQEGYPIIIKSKFGRLEIQMWASDFPVAVPTGVRERIFRLASQARQQAQTTCHICGRSGELEESGWGQVVCDYHGD